ncbi:proline-rich receptor-like protein kinase PERK8 isoform X2 [Salmo salar]|uniref:Proline-rich receptor-like protein kinase PERK8 isoform X2 n=1 Tax=Salmo salar TaxID=8030 RepID=A0A1S3R4B1_SALSA|nr:proline-rich receptor-like protein kinase PERK8 isoform X2 [Salmo salar]|eukprot:XP_014047198.1 PREDICTED: proline-rich receptor-like protein kinase PERK8 isoform X2 [Salmo salar]
MNIENNLLLCALVIFTSSSETKGQSISLPPVVTPGALQHEGMSIASPVLPLVNEDEEEPQPEPSPAKQTSPDQTNGAPTKPAFIDGDRLLQSESVTDAGDWDDMAVTNQMTTSLPTPAPAHTVNTVTATQDNATLTDSSSSSSPVKSTSPAGLPSTLGDTTYPVPAGGHLTTSTPPVLDTTPPPSHVFTPIQSSVQPSTPALTPAPTQTLPTEDPKTSGPVHVPASPPHQEVPSELTVGDEGPQLQSPLDPLLASLVSIFIITTAIVSVVLFLKFRQRTDHPDFHRLQDLPMDDLMEGTPLSRYTYSY